MEPKYPDYTIDELEQWVINDEYLWLWFIDRYELDNNVDGYDETQMCQFVEDERNAIVGRIEGAYGVYR